MKKLKVSTPAGLLAVFAHTLGMTPVESFVLVTVQGGRVGATLRVNIPTNGPAAGFVRTVVDYLLNDKEADGTILAVYTNTDGGQPHREYVEALEYELLAAGMPVREALLVGPAGWRSYFDTDAAVTALGSITDSEANTEMVFAGSNPEAGKAQDREFTGAPGNAATITRIASGLRDVDGLDFGAPVMIEARAAWTDALGTVPDTAVACQLVAYLQNVGLRDRVIADFINTDDEEYGAVLIGETSTRPTWARVDQGQALLVELLAQTPDRFRAPLYTMLGHISWYKGRSTTAVQYLDKALTATPGYRLAELLKRMIDLGFLPEVVKNKANAYPGAS
ncbi:DUF4192 domain-containing protein [Paenarthrobacter sp. Z7-10]|uniref:DUF4192 domain-containing protein n=1 Tax=Paenarthrobacter sp. Z7-10 TaxID=2787635 RepID=UPI0022A967C6|nr:DUF4192 domain-containing protein [Paenarthrobacter sp. Z7-10]MCZ2404912.1 DUF4192 domain-containing protein [Paenarthrobacter sp. Z7-10]